MRVRELEKREQQGELRAEEVLQASYRQMRKAERKAKEAMHRGEEVKWRIDGGGIRPNEGRRQSHRGGPKH